jgi:cyclic-di-GMP-binding protein
LGSPFWTTNLVFYANLFFSTPTMADTFSFDIVSDFDRQELVNAVDQSMREIQTRYDLKDTKTTLELGAEVITIQTASDFTLEAVHSILQTKALKRNLSLKIFDYGKIEAASGNRVRQEIKLKKGIPQELGKQVTKLIRDEFKKVQASIQGDAVRVSAKSKDDLQAVMQRLKQEDYPVALQFNNYR